MALKSLVLVALAAGQLSWTTPAARAGSLEDGNAAFSVGDYGAALRSWSAAAGSGNAEAAFDLGLLYDLGNGVPESAEAAFRWYRRAAEAGLGTAAFNVAVMYDSGRGAPQDRTKAAIWYARAAALGDIRAAFNLGQLYELGEGVPRNNGAALAWYRVAAAAIPEAGVKAIGLVTQYPARVAGALVPPTPAWPTGDNSILLSGPHPAVQLVWTAPVEPHRVTYFVELQTWRNGNFNELSASYVSTSSLAVTLPDSAGNFAWRVYAVAADGSGYAPSAWMRFATARSPASDSPPPAGAP